MWRIIILLILLVTFLVFIGCPDATSSGGRSDTTDTDTTPVQVLRAGLPVLKINSDNNTYQGHVNALKWILSVRMGYLNTAINDL